MVTDPPTIAPRRTSGSSKILAAMAGTVVLAAAAGLGVGFASRPKLPASPVVPTSTISATVRAAALYQTALNTIAASVGFHYVAIYPETETIIGDAGRSVGRQVVTFKSSYGVEAFTLVLDNTGTLYFQGNAPAVEDQLGVSTSTTSEVENRWVSLVPGNGPYPELASGMTVAEQGVFLPMTPISTDSVKLGGRAATQIVGTATVDDPGLAALLDIDTRSHAPLAYSSTAVTTSGPATSTVTFSAWGTQVSVTAPSAAIAWSTLGGLTPPSGYGGG
ncbi:MAG: hypothetical protein ABSC35_03290 [Candidatus Dormibacteria bacterium]